MIEPALRAVREQNMFQKGDRVLAALSGGPDSVALLHFLRTHADEFGITLSAAHFDHGLRGAESRADRDFAESLCAKWNIPFFSAEADVADEAAAAGESVEACGRRLRYAFFESLPADKIATAHHADDNAETVLLNLCRGTGLKGLCGIPPVRGKIVRPLIYAGKADILEYLRRNGLPFREDPTNRRNDFTRNYLRNEILPALARVNRQAARHISELTERLREDAAYLDDAAAAALERALDGNRAQADALQTLPGPLQNRALAAFCARNGVYFSADAAKRMRETLETGVPATLPGGRRFFKDAEGFCGFDDPAPAPAPAPFALPARPGRHETPAGVLRITETSFDSAPRDEKFNNLLFKNMLDCGMIGSEPILRPRMPGDKIALAERKVSKTLKKLFNEAGIPVNLRDKLPLLADENGVLWVPGFGTDRRARVGDGTRTVWILEFEPQRERTPENGR